MNWCRVTVFLINCLVSNVYAMDQKQEINEKQEDPGALLLRNSQEVENQRFLKSSQQFDEFLQKKDDSQHLPPLRQLVKQYSREDTTIATLCLKQVSRVTHYAESDIKSIVD